MNQYLECHDSGRKYAPVPENTDNTSLCHCIPPNTIVFWNNGGGRNNRRSDLSETGSG
jgi:hypothetical protein